MSYGAKSVSLVAKKDSYGQTFIDWFAFQAIELGLKVDHIYVYEDASLRQDFSSAITGGSDFVICAPSSIDNLKEMLYARNELSGVQSKLLFSDVAYNSVLLNELRVISQGVEGITISSDPTSGFSVSYEVRFGEKPLLGEAQAYDAMMLIAYAGFLMQETGKSDMNQALCQLVDGRDEELGSWMDEDMDKVFTALASGRLPNIKGASGSLNFDKKVYTNVLHTVYANWMLYGDEFIILDYNTSDGGKRTDATLAGWNWKNSQSQKFDNNISSITYPKLDKQWALVVASSSKWANYRHQADALKMYHFLKKQGYSDDRIVFIIADDIANNPLNPEQGVVCSQNLYEDIKIDYRLSELTPYDIEKILCGKSNNRLKDVLNADADDNIFVYWSGHGNTNVFEWNTEESFTYPMLEKTLRNMNENNCFRKMIWCVETCYAGSMAKAAKGIEGILFITAANAFETSKADVFNESLGVWMTNRFTSTLLKEFNADSSISIYNLYLKLFRNTLGSHVTIYNNFYYGNLHKENMGDFL